MSILGTGWGMGKEGGWHRVSEKEQNEERVNMEQKKGGGQLKNMVQAP